MVGLLFFLASLANGFVAVMLASEGETVAACLWSFSTGIWFAGSLYHWMMRS